MESKERKCGRRAFLINSTKLSTVTCLSCILPLSIISCSSNDRKNYVSQDQYYTSQKAKLLKDFDTIIELGPKVSTKALGESLTSKVFMDMRKEYENIIPEIPYIGGEENGNSTSQLIMVAQSLAIYRILAKNGRSIEEIGQFIYDMLDASFDMYPQIIVSVWGYFKFHVGWSEKIKEYAAMSQKRIFPMDFVYTFIEGDGEELYYGVDMTECAVQKFLRKQNAKELVPYICATDYALSTRFNRGLIRTKTLVESDYCDFRYGIDRKTQIKLPPGLRV